MLIPSGMSNGIDARPEASSENKDERRDDSRTDHGNHCRKPPESEFNYSLA